MSFMLEVVLKGFKRRNSLCLNRCRGSFTGIQKEKHHVGLPGGGVARTDGRSLSDVGWELSESFLDNGIQQFCSLAEWMARKKKPPIFILAELKSSSQNQKVTN